MTWKEGIRGNLFASGCGSFAKNHYLCIKFRYLLPRDVEILCGNSFQNFLWSVVKFRIFADKIGALKSASPIRPIPFTKIENIGKMKMLKLGPYILIAACFMSCGTSAATDSASQSVTVTTTDSASDSEEIALINSVYEKFVFAIDTEGEDSAPERYFTPNALRKLQDDYTFDCDEGPCYAYYALRTDAQDSRPGADDASLVHSIEPSGDGWYVVSYSDMGWPGKTRVRIADGKIDDYERVGE